MGSNHTGSDFFGRRPASVRYGAAAAAALAGWLLRYAVGPDLGTAAPYLTFFPVVVLSAWYGGVGPGLLTTALSAFVSLYVFTPHPWSAHGWGLARFLIGSICFSWLIPALLDVQRRARVQERWAAVTLASIADAVLTTDTQGRITFMNSAAASLTGWDAAQARGQSAGAVFRIFNEETGQPVDNPIDRVLREGVVVGLANHTALETRSGARIPIADSGAPIKDDDGKITGAALIFRDISEARKAEAARSAAEKQLSDMLESISDGFVALDHEWRYTYVNAEAERLARKSASEMLGKSIWDLFPEAVGGPLYSALQFCRNEQQPVTCELEGYETRQTLRLRAYPSAGGVSIYILDISSEREAAATTALLAAIVESSSDAIVAKDLDGRVTAWNKGAEQIFGYTAAEMIGQPVALLAPPGRPDELPAIMERIGRGERIEPYETVRRAKDGRLVDISLSVSPIYDADGAIVGASKVARDITDRKAAEQALRNSEARLSMALEAGSMGVWEWNVRSGKVAWSPQVEAMHGIARGSFGGTFEDFQRDIHPSDRERVLQKIRSALEARTDYRAEYRVVRPDRSVVWAEARGRIACDEDGRPDRMLGVCIDITARKTAEEELLRQADRLARTNADLKDFAYAASHDLQEPLRNVSTFVQLLAKRYKDKLDADANELIAYVVDSAMRMGNLIHDLLNYSRIINAEERPFVDVALSEAVEAALRNLATAVAESGAQIEAASLPPVRGDAVQLAQLFQNLISNAIKYRASESPHVWISAEMRDGECVVSVRDNGQGIDPMYHERIFGVFKRLHGSDYPGTGVGLAICKRIVERHGGRIWVESEAGRGATFRFSIAAEAKETPRPLS